MLIAQITDCHIVKAGELLSGRVDSARGLREAIDHLHTMTPRPDLVLATGDLVNDAHAEEYDNLCQLLAELELPLYVLPGNHDDRTELRRRFPGYLAAGGPEDPLTYVLDDYAVRIIALDTTVPGEHGGRIGSEQLDWLDATLAAAPERPTLIAQHHPPFTTGIGWMDAVGLADRDAQAKVVARHRQVLAVVSGHIHRPITTAFGGTMASCWPSTGAQVALALDGERFWYSDEPPALALHQWGPDSGLVSHLSRIGTGARWQPDWAIAEAAEAARLAAQLASDSPDHRSS